MKYTTADLCDNHRDKVEIADPIGFKNYGGRTKFSGKIQTLKCFEDHAPVRKALEGDGTGKVLVVDGGRSLRCSLVGEKLAQLAVKNNWNGIVVYGCIRDSAEIGLLDLGLKALDTYPISRVTNADWMPTTTVRFAGVAFHAGQFICCDEDGIITLPTEPAA